jgi:phosphoribosylglycinamide formyltransferase-1
LHIEARLISRSNYPATDDEAVAPGGQTQAEEAALHVALLNGQFDAIILMGYMKRISPRLVHEFGWRSTYTSPYQACMLNTHCGLLPQTVGHHGLEMQQFVLEQGMSDAGHSLHIVAENYDDGPLVAEHQLSVMAEDTPETLFARVQAIEKQHLPADIDLFIQERQKHIVNARVKEAVS